MFAWGANDHGQLGQGGGDDASEPLRVATLAGAKAIAAGSAHSVTVLGSGRVLVWGANDQGQLGIQGAEDRGLPTEFEGVHASEIAAAGDDTVVVTAAGALLRLGKHRADTPGESTAEWAGIKSSGSAFLGFASDGSVTAFREERMQSYSRSVFDASRARPPIPPPPAEQIAGAGTAYVITGGSVAPHTPEHDLGARLEQLGFAVSFVRDRDASGSGASASSLVVITPSAHAARLPANLEDSRTPMLILDRYALVRLGLTLERSSPQGASTGTSLAAVRPTHALAPSTQATYAIVSEETLLPWAIPGPNAQVVAVTEAGQPALFSYESGVATPSGFAAERRVALLLPAETRSYDRDAWALFDSAARWAVGQEAKAPVLSDDGLRDGFPIEAARVMPTGSGTILLVVGNTQALWTCDLKYQDRMQALGFTVELKQASAATAADATGKILVFVSVSSPAEDVLAKFKDVTVPVVVQTSGVIDDMLMVAAPDRGGTLAPFANAVVTTPSSPVAGGFVGTVTMSTVAAYQSWGTPSASGVKVLTAPGYTNQSVLFTYASGASMAGLNAPSRRALFGFDDANVATLTPTGTDIFDLMILWLTGTNTPPTVNAGPDQAVASGAPANVSLSGSVTDDGLPNPPGAVSASWTQVSGPGTVSFTNAAQAATTATLPAIGDYVLRLTGSDGTLARSDVVFISVLAPSPNGAPVVAAGPDRRVRANAALQLAAMGADDGLPSPPGALSYSWSMTSGPAAPTFTPGNAANISVSFSTAGLYTIRVTVNDGALSASDEVQVIVDPPAAALFVVSSQASPLPKEVEASQLLLGLGFTVTLKDAATVNAGDATGKAVIAISAASGSIGTLFTTSTTPIVCMKSDLFDDMGMTGTVSDTDYGGASGTQIDIIKPGHPLASYVSGTSTVYGVDAPLAWGKPAASALKIATVKDQPNKATVFAYEQSSSMVVGLAPARRVGLFADSPTAFTDSGRALFRAAFVWATQKGVPALLLTGSFTPTASEIALRNRLGNLGFAVTTKGLAAAVPSEALGKAVVLATKSPTIPAGVPGLTCPASVVSGAAYGLTATVGNSSLDWVAQYTPGSPNNQWINGYQYVGLPRPKTVSLVAPTPPGIYEARLFANDGFTLLASCFFQVTAVPAAPVPGLACPTMPVGAGAAYSVTATAGSSALDWVSQFVVEGPNSPFINGYQYVPLPRPQTLSLTAPSAPGVYEARLFANDGSSVIGSCLIQVRPALTVSDVTLTEGNSGIVNAAFQVTLARAGFTQSVSVTYTTRDNSATAGSDYTAVSGTLSFGPSETTKTVNVSVSGDTTIEPHESFFLNLSSPSAGVAISRGQARATVSNDDGSPGPAMPAAADPSTVRPRSIQAPPTRSMSSPGARPSTGWLSTRRDLRTRPGSGSTPTCRCRDRGSST